MKTLLQILGLWPRGPKEEWTVVGYVDDEFTVSDTADGGNKRDFKTRSILKISDSGKRMVEYNYGPVLAGVSEKNKPALWGHQNPMQLKAWEQGGPLPDDFVPMKVSDRKPSKLPPQIASDYNDRAS